MDRVKLFPGVIVPTSIALAVKFGTIEDKIGNDTAAWTESPYGSGSIDSEAAATIKDVERFLEEEGIRTYNPKHKKPHRNPINPLDVEPRDRYESKVPIKNGRLGTNQILDYFGFAEGAERNDFLRSFNGNPFYGAEIIRVPAYHLARFYGIHTDKVVEGLGIPPQHRKNIFKALALAVHMYGTTLTDSVVETVGLNKLPEVVENYTPLRVYRKELDLVPTRDLGQIVSALNSPAFKGMSHKDIMRELGYGVLRDPMGVPLLYHRPNTA